MAIDKQSFLNYQEGRAQTGYGAAIVVKKSTDTYYSLLVASETVPSIFGTTDEFTFDLLNSPTKGSVPGKISLEKKEVEVLHHRDNVVRFEELKDQVLDFMFIDSQFVGYKFRGKISYRVNDATADILRGTYTITPMSADPTPILDVRSLLQETTLFKNAIPETIVAPLSTDTTGKEIDVSITPDATVDTDYTIEYYNTVQNKWVTTSSGISVTVSNGVAKLKILNAAGGDGGKLYKITAAAANCAPWSTTIYVEPAPTT